MSDDAPKTLSNENKNSNEKPPFFVFRLPPGFSFGEICLAPKAQPQVEISREDAIARCLRSGPPLLGLGRQNSKNGDDDDGAQAESQQRPPPPTRELSAPLMMELQTSSGSCSVGSAFSGESSSESKQLLLRHGADFAAAESKVEVYSHKNNDKKQKEDKNGVSSSSFSSPPPVIQFHILHTGNFVRVATMPGRLYWLVQNATMHQSPDWKLHIACRPCDVAIVWNLVVLPVFFEHVTISTVGMKAVLTATRNEETGQFTTTSGEEHWPEQQTGREVTVYLFSDDPMYDENLIGEQPVDDEENNVEDKDDDDDDDDENKQQLKNQYEPTSEASTKQKQKRRRFDKNHLWVGDDPLLSDWWRVLLRRASNYSSQDLIHFVESIQQRMDVYQIPTRGCAAGDLPLTRSVSLRNEAYTCGEAVNERRLESARNNNINNTMTTPSRADDSTLMYPMNDWGWNAAAQRVPESLQGLIAHFNSDEIVEFSFDTQRNGRSKKGENVGNCCC
jgi:hypothetical protein